MKLCITLLALMLTMSAFADFKGSTFRYDTSYESFDRATSRHYEWKESHYTKKTCGKYRTCFPSEMRGKTVYIEERIVDSSEAGRYGVETKTIIYTDSNYSKPYVTYYTNRNRIVHRSYHRNHRYTRRYHTTHHNYWSHHHHHPMHHGCSHHSHHHYYYSIDWNTPEGKIVTGLHMAAIAISVASDCAGLDDEAFAICMAAAGASALSASASSAEGLEQARRESDLFNEIEKEAREEQEEAGDF